MLKRLPVFVFLLFLAGGCSRPPAGVETPGIKEANEKFAAICQQELKVNVVSRVIGNTLWVYIPLQENLIEIKASGEKVHFAKESSLGPAVNYIDAKFDSGSFLVEYDIALAESYVKEYGYSNVYSERFQVLQQGLLSAINRAYYNVEDHPLEFVTFIVADIQNGVESENTLNMLDLKKALSASQTLPQDEFMKRYISEFRGDKAAVGSKNGGHLTPRAVTMPAFLAKQMIARVNFKYQRSAFPPVGEPADEILTQVQDTLKAYKFRAYKEVILHDLRTGHKERLEPFK